MEGILKTGGEGATPHMGLLHREWEIWFSSVCDIIFNRITVSFEVKTTSLHLQWLYLQTVVLFLKMGITAR